MTVSGEHATVVRLPTHQLVTHLNESLGATLVATLSGVRDRKLPYKWAKEDGPTPRDETLGRLQAASRVFRMIAASDNSDIARAWFIGANPMLGENSPVMEIRDGHAPQVLAAARSFVEGN